MKVESVSKYWSGMFAVLGTCLCRVYTWMRLEEGKKGVWCNYKVCPKSVKHSANSQGCLVVSGSLKCEEERSQGEMRGCRENMQYRLNLQDIPSHRNTA